ncbi:MAG: energy-coupling factor transporter transmembrane protein EcfT [Bacilli bacterium]|nr:energy-coupling factor transporter transmembrane protein EcfT [Bacilli bacterium]
MLDNVMIGRYYPIKSQVHQMNSLAKIICTFLFVILSLISSNLVLNSLLFLMVIIIVLMSKIELKIYLKIISSLKLFILFIIVINLIFKVSLSLIAVMVIRLIIIVLYTSVLTLTTAPTELTYGLEQFLSPLKYIGVPVSKIALILTLAIRFIPNLLDESKRIMKAQISRGARYDSFKNKMISLKYLIVPLFMITFKKADDLAQTMEVRLFSINSKKNNYRSNKWHLYDSYMILIHSCLLLAVIVSEVIK